jgi:hypothetical protein
MTIEEATLKLQSLQDDPTMRTLSRYSPTAPQWPDSRLPFVEIHLAYLRSHKLVDPAHYISNLELMIKKR